MRWMLLLVGGTLVAAVWAAPLVDRHHRGLRVCRACHNGGEGLLQEKVFRKRCGTCHEGLPAVTARALRVAASEEAPRPQALQELEKLPERVRESLPQAPEARGELPPGMRVPMYYEGTRIGADPNPMVLIPAGPFTMGSDDRLPDEGPAHVVDLPAFWMDKYEVTNLQYKRFIDATGRRSPDHFRNRTFPPGKADHPVTWVTWFDAKAYCEWAGKRLPTEQEWEKAARGTDGRWFPWGSEFDVLKANTPQRWAWLRQEGDTTPVGAFEAGKSPYGLYDMAGNVWEWTASWYLPHPGNRHPSENYGKRYRVLKGGSWWDCSFYRCGISAPVFNRSFFNPYTKNQSFGFRCARDATAEEAARAAAGGS